MRFHGGNLKSVPSVKSVRILSLGLTMNEVENYPQNSRDHADALASIVVDAWSMGDLLRYAQYTLALSYVKDDALFLEDYLWNKEEFDEGKEND